MQDMLADNEATKVESARDEQSLANLLEEVTQALDAGQLVDIDELARQHPQHADRLRELMPTMKALASWGRDPTPSGGGRATGSHMDGVLGDFRIIRELGRGGMGTVFEAEQISVGRKVALKVLPFAVLAQEHALKRFRNEVRAAAALDHPNIVSVYSVGEERGIHYYAMQFIRGLSLAELIAEMRNAECGVRSEDLTDCDSGASATGTTRRDEQARLSTVANTPRDAERYRSAARLGIQAAEALQHAHDQGVLHRDIKPANLLIDAGGKLYVTDFGLARIEADAGLTLTGDIVGTLRYMAPEQALAKRVVIDHRADIYSLGATLYELLTLQPVFGNSDRGELLKRIAFDEPIPLRKHDRSIPGELETIVLKTLAKSAGDRYGTAQELADDLRAMLDHRPISARRPTLVEKVNKLTRRYPAATIASVAAMLVVMVVLAVSNAIVAHERVKTADALAASELAREKAQQRLELAREAVDDMYTGVAESWLGRSGELAPMQREFLEKALAFYQRIAAEADADRESQLGSIAAELRVARLEEGFGRFSNAIAIYEHAVERLEPLTRDFPADLSGGKELAQALNLCGKMHWLNDRHILAEPLMVRAIEIQEFVVKSEPNDGEQRRFLAGCIHDLALVYRETFRFEETESAMDRVHTLLEEVCADFPEDLVFKHDLAATENSLGSFLLDRGRRPEAKRHLHRAVVLAEELLAADPGEAEHRFILAYFLDGYAKALPADEREVVWSRASSILLELADEFPRDPNFLFVCIGVHQNYANHLLVNERFDECEQMLTTVLVPAEELSTRHGDTREYRMQYYNLLIDLADCLWEQGKMEERRKVLRRGNDEVTRLVETYPDDGGIRFEHTFDNMMLSIERWGETDDPPSDEVMKARLNTTPTQAAIGAFGRLLGGGDEDESPQNSTDGE